MDYTTNLANEGVEFSDSEGDFKYALSKLDVFSWKKASIKLNSELKALEARYNPMNDALEINYNGEERGLAKRNNLNLTFIDTNETYMAKSYYGDDGKI